MSDSAGTTATPHAVLERRDRAVDHDAILAAAAELGAGTIVVGLPLTLDGEVGTAARRVLSEVDELRRRAGGRLHVEVHDERMSTVTAERAMIEGGARRRTRRERVDALAATVILQSWLDGTGTGAGER